MSEQDAQNPFITPRIGRIPTSAAPHLGTRRNLSYQSVFLSSDTQDKRPSGKRKRAQQLDVDGDSDSDVGASGMNKRRPLSLLVVLRIRPVRLEAALALANLRLGNSMSVRLHAPYYDSRLAHDRYDAKSRCSTSLPPKSRFPAPRKYGTKPNGRCQSRGNWLRGPKRWFSYKMDTKRRRCSCSYGH